MGFRDEESNILNILIIVVLIAIVVALFAPQLSPNNNPNSSRFSATHEIALKENYSYAGSRMRVVADALEAYYVDHGMYPPPRPMSAVNVPAGSLPGGVSLAGLTTHPDWKRVLFPVAVAHKKLNGKPVDIHDPYTRNAQLPFGYFTENDRWVLHAVGDDGVYSLMPATDINWDADDWAQEQERIRVTAPMYDPTNGNYSAGDHLRFEHY